MIKILQIKSYAELTNIILLFFGILCISLGILFIPTALFLMIVLIVIGSSVIALFPKIALFGVGIFLIFQELIARQFAQTPFLYTMIDWVDETVILVAFLALLAKNLFYKLKWKRSAIDIPLTVFVAIAVLGSIKSHIVSYKIGVLDLYILLKSFFVFYIFYNLDLNKDDINKAFKIFLCVSLGVLFLGFIDLLIPSRFRSFIHTKMYSDYHFNIQSAKSVFSHPSAYGWLMAFSVVLCLALFMTLNKKKYLTLAIVFFLGVVSSLRLKPVLGILAVVLVATALGSFRNKLKYIVIILLLCLICFGIFGNLLSTLFHEKVYDYLQTPYASIQARNVLYSTGFLIAKDFFPLGSGLGTFGGWISTLYYSPIYSWYGIDTIYGLERGGAFLTDTFWPYIIGQFGFFGLFLYIWIMGVFAKNFIEAFKVSNDVFRKALNLAALFVLIEALLETMADPVFLRPPQNYYIFMVLGIAMSFKESAKNA